MSLRRRLKGIGSSIKGKLDALTGDDVDTDDLDDMLSATESVTVMPTMDEAQARAVLDIGEAATLDVVRAAAAAKAKAVHPLAARGDEGGLLALDRIATAAELLEERLLPLGSITGSTGSSSTVPSTDQAPRRPRAT